MIKVGPGIELALVSLGVLAMAGCSAGPGTHPADDGGRWVLPTAAQERQILADWAAVVPAPAFDYAYSWGSQNGDTALARSPALRALFAAKNASSRASRND